MNQLILMLPFYITILILELWLLLIYMFVYIKKYSHTQQNIMVLYFIGWELSLPLSG